MKKNVGTVDKVIRILIAVVVVVSVFYSCDFRHSGNNSSDFVSNISCNKSY